ncbi:MAG: ATP synthase subunit b [Rhodomicrobium sp.]|nr:MAG: ATP synthase subunit b [Rhodomicrobium sp.]
MAEQQTELHKELDHSIEVPAAEKKVFPPFDQTTFESQLVWLALTFVLLYVVLSRMALPRIGEVLEERQDRIQRDMDEANRLREETDKAIATYEEALATARKKANEIAEETRADLKAEIAKEQQVVEDKIAAKTSQAEASITAAKEAAFSEVGKIAQATTSTIVEKLLGTSVSEDEINKALN